MHAAHCVRAILGLGALVGCSSDVRRDPGPDIVSPQLSVADAASGPSASGHANWFNAAGEFVSRTFNAREHDGIVRGNFVQHVTSVAGVRRVNKGDIDCLLILGPRDAVLSGPVHENANPALVGMTQIFRVQDNGEGSRDLEDAISPLFFQTPQSGINCRNFVPPVVTPIDAGNVQVKP